MDSPWTRDWPQLPGKYLYVVDGRNDLVGMCDVFPIVWGAMSNPYYDTVISNDAGDLLGVRWSLYNWPINFQRELARMHFQPACLPAGFA